ncbi:MAG: M23 family metallopeptidase, partial [Chloroflexota bacterium]
DCQLGDRWCAGGYGNLMIIYHPQGYLTFYAHLESLAPIGTAVKAGDVIGTMGSTGNSTGPHLHFGLYRDNGNQKWDGEDVDRPVDPFGWRGTEGDPWVVDRQGPISHYLWRYPLAQTETFAGAEGLTMTDITNRIGIHIVPNTFSGEGTLELALGPVADSTRGTRRVGQAFWLRLQEWLPDVVATPQAMAQLDQGLSHPITITTKFTDTQVKHLDLTKLTFARWNDAARSWEPLTSTLNLEAHTITAQTDRLGNFDLQAPLLCPNDTVEPDDAFFSARTVEANSDSLKRTFDTPLDEDWFLLETSPNRTYHIKTQALSNGVDTVIELYNVDSQTKIFTDDDSGAGNASHLILETALGGFFFVRALPTANSVTGCQAKYDLAVTVEPIRVFLPLTLK